MLVAGALRAVWLAPAQSLAVMLLTVACSSAKQPDVPRAAGLPDDVVERAALPMYALEQGNVVHFPDAVALAAAADAVCIGESHDNPHHHFAQLELVRALVEQAATKGRPTAVGFEMFRQPATAALKSYVQHGDAQRLHLESNFDEQWGGGFEFYRPILEAARDGGSQLLALNARRELTKSIARHGLDELPDELRGKLPELDLTNAEHRAFFGAAMGMPFAPASAFPVPHPPPVGHPEIHPEAETPPPFASPHPERAPDRPSRDATTNASTTAHGEQAAHGGLNVENLYAAQVIWDETMAQTTAQWLKRNNGGLVVIIAGSGHCHRSAIPDRIRRRGPFEALAGRAALASELGRAEAPRDDQFDLLLVLDDDTQLED